MNQAPSGVEENVVAGGSKSTTAAKEGIHGPGRSAFRVLKRKALTHHDKERKKLLKRDIELCQVKLLDMRSLQEDIKDWSIDWGKSSQQIGKRPFEQKVNELLERVIHPLVRSYMSQW